VGIDGEAGEYRLRIAEAQAAVARRAYPPLTPPYQREGNGRDELLHLLAVAL